MSDEFTEFLKRNEITHITSAPYHPSSNGLAERAVQSFKQGMKKFTQGNLTDRLARFLYHYRNTPHTVLVLPHLNFSWVEGLVHAWISFVLTCTIQYMRDNNGRRKPMIPELVIVN